MTTTVRVTPRCCNLIPCRPDSDYESPERRLQPRQRWWWCDGGRPYWRSLLLYRRNNRLRIFLFIFFRESERGEAARIEKKTFHLEFHIQAWPALLKNLSDVVLREIHCAELELAGSPPWRRHSSVFQHKEPMTWRPVWNWGWGREMGRFIFVSFFFSLFCFFFWRILLTARRRLWACILSDSTNILPWACAGLCVCLCGICNSYPCNIAFLSIPLPLSPHSTAFVLHSIIPLLQSGVEKRESGNFIIITSHFCNLYAMRTLRACSYNQVCRNHVRCFTNSWGDGSSSGGYGFPCC